MAQNPVLNMNDHGYRVAVSIERLQSDDFINNEAGGTKVVGPLDRGWRRY
jgi:hypothetical protein